MKFTFCNREYRNLSDLRSALQDVGTVDSDRVEREFERIFAEPGLWDDFLDFVDPDGIADELEGMTDMRKRVEVILGNNHPCLTGLRQYWIEEDARLYQATYRVVDLENWTISGYATVPTGGWTDEYKTSKIVLRRIEPGTFTMGSPTSEEGRYDDETQHRVTLTKPFYMGVFQVTQGQWERVMGSNPSDFHGVHRPVEEVSWYDCLAFCQEIGRGLCLPTEAEWEYACRAGTTTSYSWGNARNGDRANCDGNYPYGTTTKGSAKHGTCDVGSYAPNAWGLYDMHGNVWEWCADWFAAYGGDATDPMGPASGTNRVFRGGCWRNSAGNCRSACRDYSSPGSARSNLGFRLCCSAGPSE